MFYTLLCLLALIAPIRAQPARHIPTLPPHRQNIGVRGPHGAGTIIIVIRDQRRK